MKNNYLKTRFASVFEGERRAWINILVFGFLMLFAHLSTYAQGPCDPKLAITITTYDAADTNTNNAKIRISGITNNSYRVGFSEGPSYTGPAFAAAPLYSSLDSGFISKTLDAPITFPGRQYTVRVFNATGSCVTDSVFYLPYVNYNYTPTFVDLEATISRTPAEDVPMGASVTIIVALKNAGNEDATGVEFTLGNALGLTLTGSSTVNGTFDQLTGLWTVGTIPKGTTYNLSVTYTVNTRGIKEIKGEVTKMTGLDIDSETAPNSTLEDDEAQICISTHRDYCNGDEYTFELTSGNYAGVVWQRSTDNGATWSTITGSTADYEIISTGTKTGALLIKSIGDYKYYKDSTSTSNCGFQGCCPVKVIPGLPPILTKPNDKVICYGDSLPTFISTNTQIGYSATFHTTYGITTPINNLSANPGFLSDQGVFKYQWYNNNGPSNPTTTALAADTTLSLVTLPTAVGRYNYRLISVQDGHTSCTDSIEVSFIINQLPVPLASSNSPICQEDTIFLSARNTAISDPLNPTLPLAWSWTGPAGFTHNDSTQTILNAQEPMEGDYIVTASYTTNGLGCSNSDTINVKINPLPDRPLAIDTIYCQEIDAKKLSAIFRNTVGLTQGDSLRWYEGIDYEFKETFKPDLSTKFGYNVGPTPNTSAVAGGYWWNVTAVDANGCQSHPDTLAVTIDAKPSKPSVWDIAYCEDYPTDSLEANASAGNYKLIWYGVNKTNIPGDSTTRYDLPDNLAIGTYNYWVSQYNTVTGCQSDTSDFDVFIKDTPVPPVVVEPTYCVNEPTVDLIATPVITNTVTNALNTLTWYWQGDTVTAAPRPVSTLAGAEWAYVTQTTLYDTLLCESPQAPLKITVNPLPVASVIPVSALCIGTLTQNNGQLILTRYRDSDQVDWSMGSTFSSTSPDNPSPGFAAIPVGGVIASGLSNPSGASQAYTVRIKNFHPGNAAHPAQFECYIDVTVPLSPKDCTCPGGYCEPATVTKTK